MSRRALLAGVILLSLTAVSAWWTRRAPPAPVSEVRSERARPTRAWLHVAAQPTTVPAEPPRPVRTAPFARVLITTELPESLSAGRCDTQDEPLLSCPSPAAEASIVEAVASREGDVMPVAELEADAEGWLALPALPPGRHFAWVTTDGGVQAVPLAGLARLEDAPHRHPLSLRGVVTGIDGGLVEGADVTAIFSEHSRFFDARTDRMGRFTLDGMPGANTYQLVVRREGFFPEIVTLGDPGARSIPILLSPRGAFALRGRVVRVAGPAEHVEVTLWQQGSERRVRTDREGRFSFLDVRAGHASLSAEAEGESATESVDAPADEVILSLAGGRHRIFGFVRDSSGAPVARSFVEVGRAGVSCGNAFTEFPTDGDGGFRSGPLSPGRYIVYARKRGFETERVEVELDEAEARVDFRLSSLPSVLGRVVDEDGAPIEGVSAWLEDGPGDNGVSTDADGRFSLDAPRDAGAGRITLHGRGFLELTTDLEVPWPGERVFVLERGYGLSGSVTEADGTPANVYVQLSDPDGGEGANETTDPNGRFEFHALRGDQVIVTLSPRDQGRAEIPVGWQVRLPLPEGLHVRLAPRRTVKLLVEDQEGRPARERYLTFVFSASTDPRFAFTRADGRIEIDLPEGEESLRIRPTEGGVDETKIEWTRFSLGAGEQRYVLPEIRTLRGRVVDERGAPVAEFTAYGRRFSNPGGQFEFPTDDFPSHGMTVESADQTASAVVSSAELKRPGPIEVVLTKVTPRCGQVRSAATGAPLPATRVDHSGDQTGDSPLGEYVETDREGRFCLRHAGPGGMVSFTRYRHVDRRLILTGAEGELDVVLEPAALVRVRRDPRWPDDAELGLLLSDGGVGGPDDEDAEGATFELAAGAYRLTLGPASKPAPFVVPPGIRQLAIDYAP